jgi:two-component system, cell cycle response regulator
MSGQIAIALCGLSAKDARLIEIVSSRAPGQHKFVCVDAAANSPCQIAMIDMQSPTGPETFQRVRASNPKVVPVCISDMGTMGESRFRLARRSLLLHLLRVLEQICEEELRGAKVSTLQPRANSTTPTATSNSSNAFSNLPTPSAAVKKLEPLCALVVDDSNTVRTQLQAALQRVGIQAQLAENAEQASKILQTRAMDLIFLDVVMPGMDGYDLCRQIKQNSYTRGIPIIMLTSRSSPFDRARGALAGCDSYLVKPITTETFYTAVDKVLAKVFRNDRNMLSARGYVTAATAS